MGSKTLGISFNPRWFMKNILIVVGSYTMGGTIASLYSFLTKIKEINVEVDVFCRLWEGDFKGKLPNCSVLPENVWLSHRMTETSFFLKILNYLLWMVRKALSFIGVDLFKQYCWIGGRQINSAKYDAIIGFDESLAQFLSYMPAQKRINWIHCDYRRYANGRDESRYYDKIDTVVCVSEFVKSIFSEIYPQYKDKTVAIHNVINVEDIVTKSLQPADDKRFDTSGFTIISCGRLDPVKQFTKIPSIAKQVTSLTDKPFKWYIIGNGSDESRIREEIIKNDVGEIVILLGKQNTPYAYMAKSNLYVCTSSSESFPLVVNEAKALCVPVVCNNFPSAKESVTSSSEGIIATIDKFPEIIASYIDKPVKNNCCTIDNKHILEQIAQIL